MMARAASAVSRAALRRHMSSAAASVPEVKTVGVVGMGLMGHGIVQTAAEAGFNVVGVDAFPDAADKAMARIKGSLSLNAARAVKKGGVSEEDATAAADAAFARISTAAGVDALAGCDLVIEAMPESVELKRRVWSDVRAAVPSPSAVFATNTSSIQLADMAAAADAPGRFVGLHFFNPVQVMRLVEVVRLDDSDPAVVDTCVRFVRALRKEPVLCKDTPGFVVNRLLVPYMAQGMALLDRGEADVPGIDTAMRLGAGHPMGPFTLADYVGLDTCLSILEGWTEKFPDEPAFIIPDVLRQLVKAGHYGRKTGQGFYTWDGDKPTGVAFGSA